MITIDEMRKLGETTASMYLYKEGEFNPFILLFTKMGVLPIPVPQENYRRIPLIAAVEGCRKAGDFLGLTMVSEAWVSPRNDADPRPPAERPDAEHRVVLNMWDEKLKKQLIIYSIIRNEKKILLGPKVNECDEFECWLDLAFK